MAIGLKFYRDQQCTDLKDSLETEMFTLLMNDMFDAMNRKFPAEGIRKEGQDIKVFYMLFVCGQVFVFCINYN